MRSHFSNANSNNLQTLGFSFLYCFVGSAEVELSNSFLSDEKKNQKVLMYQSLMHDVRHIFVKNDIIPADLSYRKA